MSNQRSLWARLWAWLLQWWVETEPAPPPNPTPGPGPLPTPDPVPDPTPEPGPDPEPEPDPEPVPEPSTLPAPGADLTRWKLTLPIENEDGDGAREVKQPELATYSHPKWFRRLAGLALAFRAPIIGVTTKGSDYPRSELREMNEDGTPAAWSSSEGEHTLELDEAFTELPSGKPHLVGAQIHDGQNDISVFRLEGSKLWITDGNVKAKLITDAYVLGTRFLAKFVVAGDVIRAYYNGQLVHTISRQFDGAYFKGGAYTQANETNASPVSEDNAGEVVIYGLRVTHSEVPVDPAPGGDPDPEPTPDPVPGQDQPRRVIMVIRHGEKDDDGDGEDDVLHHLSERGKARRDALVGLFGGTDLRPGLYRPGRAYASQGKSSSRRMTETLQPLVNHLGIEMNAAYDAEKEYKSLAKAILSDSHEAVIVCCEHSAILDLCGEFGDVTPDLPEEWPGDCFDIVLVFEAHGPSNSSWVLHQVPELLLPGDRATAI